jgi:hypothetical protein
MYVILKSNEKLFNKNEIKDENREPPRFSDDPQVPPSKEFAPKSKNPRTLLWNSNNCAFTYVSIFEPIDK